MLHLQEGLIFFERFTENMNGLITKGIIISNSIDISFGRVYFRTNIDIIGNYYLNHNNKYISYRIDNFCKGIELISGIKETFQEQKEDIFTLKTNLKELFPNVSIQILISDYDFIQWFDEIHYNDVCLTGIPCLEITEPMDSEIKVEYEELKSFFVDYNKNYLSQKQSAKEFRNKRQKQY